MHESSSIQAKFCFNLCLFKSISVLLIKAVRRLDHCFMCFDISVPNNIVKRVRCFCSYTVRKRVAIKTLFSFFFSFFLNLEDISHCNPVI